MQNLNQYQDNRDIQDSKDRKNERMMQGAASEWDDTTALNDKVQFSDQ